MSIGGATAGIDLSSSTVADRFVATVVPILKKYNFDGIDIDIETGLIGSGNINQLSTSQANLIRIIDGVLAQMPSNFGLTMAPETAYVTGGSVVYGSIWGAYLPIVKKYADNGRLWWLNMQYYNGSMYGCSGDSYSAGTVQGFVAQTDCLNHGPGHPGHHDPGSVRQAGPGTARAARRRRRLHVAVAGVAGLEQLQRRPQGPDDLVHQLGRVEELDLRRQRQVPARPLAPGGGAPRPFGGRPPERRPRGAPARNRRRAPPGTGGARRPGTELSGQWSSNRAPDTAISPTIARGACGVRPRARA